MTRAPVKTTADFLMRLLFFGAAPYQLVLVGALFPVTGAIVQIGIALAFFFVGEAARSVTRRATWMAPLIANQLQFEAYYRRHRPRPFLYYVFYPLLFPYWLTQPEARREFLLYKGYTLPSFVLLVGGLALQFVRAFPPELGFAAFWPIAGGSFLVETVVVLTFLMPMVTTVVHYHTERSKGRLAILLAAALVSLTFAAIKLERRRDPVVSYAARLRAQLRTAARPAGAEAAERKALAEAWRYLPREKGDVDSDGKVEGLPLDKARDALAGFYKADEASAFDLWFARSAGRSIMVVYSEGRRGKAPLWLAMRKDGTRTHDVADLPPDAFRAMKHAAQ